MATTPSHLISLRCMQLDDLSDILSIEKEYNPSPWLQQYFENSLRLHHDSWVLFNENTKKIIGYAILRLTLDEGEILNIAVDIKYRRQGLGAQLLQHLIFLAHQKKIKTLFLEVRKSNLSAQAFYHKFNFHQIGVRPGYYPNRPQNREDALLFAREIEPSFHI